MLHDLKSKSIDRQMNGKYDNKNRIKKERKTARIDFRVSESVKQNFNKLVAASGLSQSDAFCELLSNGHVNGIIGGDVIAHNISVTTNKLSKIIDCVQENNYRNIEPPVKNQLEEVAVEFRELKKTMLKMLEGRT